eukprot:57156-Rhodomonas_salina.2
MPKKAWSSRCCCVFAPSIRTLSAELLGSCRDSWAAITQLSRLLSQLPKLFLRWKGAYALSVARSRLKPDALPKCTILRVCIISCAGP